MMPARRAKKYRTPPGYEARRGSRRGVWEHPDTFAMNKLRLQLRSITAIGSTRILQPEHPPVICPQGRASRRRFPTTGRLCTMYHERLGITADAPADTDFADTLSQHVALLRSYARRLAGNAADADDLVQDTMLRCWSARYRFQPGSNFGAWSRVVMRNSFLSGRRRDRFHADLPEDAFDRMPGAEGGQDLAVAVSDIRWALSQLSCDQRDAVMLAAEGVPSTIAALQLSIPEGTFKSRVARGRRHLRQLIDDSDDRPHREPTAEMIPSGKRRSWKGVIIG